MNIECKVFFFSACSTNCGFVEEWKDHVCWRLPAYLGVNFDGNPNWVLIFDFPKQVLNNTQLGIILFQTWHLSQPCNHDGDSLTEGGKLGKPENLAHQRSLRLMWVKHKSWVQ
jgi:hypothetical protein